MAAPKKIIITESIAELRKLQKASIPMIAARIRVMIAFKEHEATGISKRAVADLVGVNHNSVQTWRRMYEQGGISAVLHYEKQSGRPAGISPTEHTQIEQKLNNPRNGLRGYVELLAWMEKEFGRAFKYNTVLKYSHRHFQSKVKAAPKKGFPKS